MRRFIHLYAIALILLLPACVQSSVQPLLETTTPVPLPTETPLPPTPTFTPELTSTPIPKVSIRRGINLGNMLEAPNEGDWGLTVREEYFDLIKAAGFDFVRLPVRWSAHPDESWSYMSGTAFFTIHPAFFGRVDEIVGWALERDLAIILDFHHYEEMMVEPHEERFLFIWQQIAEHYQAYPPRVMFELLNEPANNVTAPLWNIYVHDALRVIRESNPTRTVIFGPVNWNAYDWISTLDLPDDENIIVTFHYYLPFEFTHQGAEWVEGSNPWLGTTWPDNEERQREIRRDFEHVADWANRKNVRILLGEFGAYSKADMASRVRWTAFVRSEAERRGFAWAYWEFAAGFGTYDPDAMVWRDDLLKALIP